MKALLLSISIPGVEILSFICHLAKYSIQGRLDLAKQWNLPVLG